MRAVVQGRDEPQFGSAREEMKARRIVEGVSWVGAIDWQRRMFDSLIPIPHGTTYNAYLVEGREKTALLDTVDTAYVAALAENLKSVQRIDYLVSHHAEQDHSGAIPFVLEKHPEAVVLATPKGKEMLVDHLQIPSERIRAVSDGETLELGGKSLRFIHAPWQHWPETMMSYLAEDQMLFSCDLFGAHLASTDLFAKSGCVEGPVKAYYAEIMMPFAKVIQKNLGKLSDLDVAMIAPSHGPIHANAAEVLNAHQAWIGGPPKNLAVVLHVTMHGSTQELVERFLPTLGENGVAQEAYDLTKTDLGQIATALVDAATLIVATPTVLGGAHPQAVMAAYLAGALRPKVKFASVIGSYGWGGNAVNQITDLLVALKPEILPPVQSRGFPKDADFQAVDDLAKLIAEKHAGAGFV